MFYEAELRFLRETFRKCRIPATIIDLNSTLQERQDLDLTLFYEYLDTNIPIAKLLPPIQEKVIYRLADPFFHRYLCFKLPELPTEGILLVGPYLETPLTESQLLEWAEAHQVPPGKQAQLMQYAWSLPIFSQGSHLHVMLEAFMERLWGKGNYSVEDVDQTNQAEDNLLLSKASSLEQQDAIWNMKNMERRYAMENEILDAVSNGQAFKADSLLPIISSMAFENRLADPIRNAKNYSIIMNTLLRKAAERGGVHPLYLDSASSEFATKIEQTNTVDALQHLMRNMFHSYCHLVKKHSTKNYSPLVQHAITLIDGRIAEELSLNSIAGLLNVSSSYFSTLFKKETGITLTEYINKRRIKHAKYLLESTKLQIQTIAQHCGIVDVHYFSKVFKKMTGMTPKEYRQSLK